MKTLTKKEVINSNEFVSRLAQAGTVNGYDFIVLDLASLDDDGWQVRESYVSPHNQDAFLQFTHGDGYMGWDVAPQCCFPEAAHTQALCALLGLDESGLADLAEALDKIEHLNSTDWDMLERLQGQAAEENEEDEEDA